jgi:ribonuclease T2
MASAVVLLSGCRESTVATETKPLAAVAKKQKRTAPGKFDFYVMSLSWSPGFCATPAGRNDDTQCGPQRNFAFVLHGLWPQYEERGWPENCGSGERPDAAVVAAMLPIMPSPKLVSHEWSKHGTCSGLSVKEYFEEASDAFRGVKIPSAYQAPMKQITVDPDKVQSGFAAANPAFPAGSFVVTCTSNGRFLQEVRACLTKELTGRPCNREVLRSACKSNQVIMRPVR